TFSFRAHTNQRSRRQVILRCGVGKKWRLIPIDIDRTFQVDEEQLAFYRQQSTCGLPIVLLIHIPLSLPIFRAENRSPLCGETEADLTFPVEAMGKLATMWGALKNRD
ncbi:MAG: hypothetical protein ACE1Z4_01245, partial [Gammaproteobacteria bacterium]